jgi:hypothetical protein
MVIGKSTAGQLPVEVPVARKGEAARSGGLRGEIG